MSLEILPQELKCLILHALPDLRSLRNAVHAVPSYHSAYLSHRRSILTSVLTREMSPTTLLSAMAIVETSKLTKDHTFLFAFVAVFQSQSDDTRALREGPGPGPGTDQLILPNLITQRVQELSTWSETDLISIAKTHTIITALTPLYGAVCGSKNPLTDQSIPYTQRIPLSRIETARVQRAFYRVQLFCALFSDVDDPLVERFYTFRHAANMRAPHFLMRLEFWEAEEVACIWSFLCTWYQSHLEFYGVPDPELRFPKRTKEDDSEPIYTDFFWRSDTRATQIERYLRLGLPFFHSILPPIETTDPDEAWRAMLDRNYRDKVRQALEPHILPSDNHRASFLTQAICGAPYKSWAYSAPHSAAPVKFAPDEAGKRNLVWAMRGDECNLERMRSWGYVFWDFERLDSWGFFQPDWNARQDVLLNGIRNIGRRLRDQFDPFAAWHRTDSDVRGLVFVYSVQVAFFCVFLCMIAFDSFNLFSIAMLYALDIGYCLFGLMAPDTHQALVGWLVGGRDPSSYYY